MNDLIEAQIAESLYDPEALDAPESFDGKPAEQVRQASIYELMPRVMADIGAVGKNGYNSSQNFAFRGIDDVMNAVQSALIKHGVFYTPNVLDYQINLSPSGKQRVVTARISYRFFGPAGDSVTVVGLAEGADMTDKAANKALAAGLKYALLHTFCIPTEEQVKDDADAAPTEPVTTAMDEVNRILAKKPSTEKAELAVEDTEDLTPLTKPLTQPQRKKLLKWWADNLAPDIMATHVPLSQVPKTTSAIERISNGEAP